MREKWKLLCSLAIAMALSIGGSLVTYAENINHVNVRFSGTEPREGEALEEINVQGGDNERYFTRAAVYQKDGTYWEAGDTPIVKVELYSQNGNQFTCNGKSHFSLSGMGAKYVSARILDNGTGLELTVSLTKLPSDLDSPSDVYWEGHRARWEHVEDAEKYEVSLYRNDSHVTTVTATGTSHSFSSAMERSGDYSFRVRAVDHQGNQKGAWSDYSDSCYVDRDDSSHGSGYNDNHNPSCPSYTNDSQEGWRQNQVGWWYRNGDGSYVKNNWLQRNGIWYYFNGNGYMCTGWIEVQGKWYYMNGQGAMLSNTMTPDGYFVDDSGAWVPDNGPKEIVNQPMNQGEQAPTQSKVIVAGSGAS